MDSLIETIMQLDPAYVYVAVFLISFIENIFPPFPSDVIVVFCGSLIAIGRGSPVETLVLSTLGSTLGFMAMYWIGDTFGVKILEKRKIPFIPYESVIRVETWFRRWGYWIVIINRFLAGTRAVVSFFAGMSEMSLPKTAMLSAISALAWNSILVYLGYLLGDNWRQIGDYLATYSTAVTVILTASLAGWLLYKYVASRKSKNR